MRLASPAASESSALALRPVSGPQGREPPCEGVAGGYRRQRRGWGGEVRCCAVGWEGGTQRGSREDEARRSKHRTSVASAARSKARESSRLGLCRPSPQRRHSLKNPPAHPNPIYKQPINQRATPTLAVAHRRVRTDCTGLGLSRLTDQAASTPPSGGVRAASSSTRRDRRPDRGWTPPGHS